jgi:hypothetical protein
MTNTKEVCNGCGGRSEIRSMNQKKDEIISRSKLGRMGMMVRWKEVGAQLGIGIK